MASFASFAQSENRLNGCNTTCAFSECMVSCDRGLMPSCNCILGAFATCSCKSKTSTVSTGSSVPGFRNADKLNATIKLLNANGLEDYGLLFSNIRTSMEQKSSENYSKFITALEALVNSNQARSADVEKYILR